jgi:hypothetical protein
MLAGWWKGTFFSENVLPISQRACSLKNITSCFRFKIIRHIGSYFFQFDAYFPSPLSFQMLTLFFFTLHTDADAMMPE